MVKYDTKDGTTSLNEINLVKSFLTLMQKNICTTRDQIDNTIEALDSMICDEALIRKLQTAGDLLKDVQTQIHEVKESITIAK